MGSRSSVRRRAVGAGLMLTMVSAAVLPAQNDKAKAEDPAEAEVALPSAPGWHAHLALDAGVGVWTVIAAQLQPHFGCPELIALDDSGQCTVLRSYSGKWTPLSAVVDGKWLAPTACGDLDPAHPGPELYTGGQGGRLWQIRPRRTAGFDAKVVGEWIGEEIHTVVLGPLDNRTGSELLVFMKSGRCVRVDGDLSITPMARMPGRVRQAVAIESPQGPRILTVSRTGELALLHLDRDQLHRETLAKEPMGLGRIALGKASNKRIVCYVSRDDGVILRFAGPPTGPFQREIIYVGPQGPRGLAAGPLHADPARESVAVFGYSAKVELISREPDQPWQVETLFVAKDKGHWLTTAELDGRNTTRELVGSGFGGRVFVLSRPPGYGMEGTGAAVSTGAGIEPGK